MAEERQEALLKIDIVKTFKYLMGFRKQYFIYVPLVTIITYLLILTVPRYYSCEVRFAPEQTSAGSTIGSIMSSLGFDAKIGGDDGLSPNLYPDIIKTNDFLLKLMEVPVMDKEGVRYATYREYQESQGRIPLMQRVRKMLGLKRKPVISSSIETEQFQPSFFIDRDMELRLENLSDRISCRFDPNTITLELTYTDDDPLICALMADTIMSRLQSFIITYRTQKARFDLDYTQGVFDEAKIAYDSVSNAYAQFCMANRNVVSMDFQIKLQQLENEMSIRTSTYTSISSQLQLAKAKVQENIPTFTVFQSATVPNKPAGPKRMIISIAMGILAALCMSFYFLRGHMIKVLA